jgi:hypothetical protein
VAVIRRRDVTQIAEESLKRPEIAKIVERLSALPIPDQLAALWAMEETEGERR